MAVRKSGSTSSRNSTGKSSSTKRTAARRKAGRTSSRKRKPKIKLDMHKVGLLLSVIFLVSTIFIAFSVLSSSGKRPAQAQQTASIEQSKQNAMAQNAKAQASKPKQNKVPDTVKAQPAAPEHSVAAPLGSPSKSNSTSVNQKSSSAKPAPAVVAAARPDKPEKPSPEKPSAKFNIPKAKNNAKLVIVIDDAGLSAENCRKYAELPFPVTIAVLPRLRDTKSCAKLIQQYGQEMILHQPMQSLNHNLDPGPGKITVDMTTYEIAQTVKQNLDELGPYVKGLNNHEGSEVTSNVIKIGTVLDVCQERGIYFLDSRTTAATQAPQAALERDMTIFEKSGPYIDNEISRTAMLNQIYKSLEAANKNGSAIIIGHVDKSVKILPALLREMYPELKQAGYVLTTPGRM
ncbi:MAG: divergent polysaccharide deacetylase family protein [Treponema sp.]|nr:divergent polysaccharide deacetylase family protein [Treponema sp.]